MTLLAQSLPGIEIAFYILSIAVILLGFATAAFKAAVAWGRGRETWDEQLRLSQEIERNLAQHLVRDDNRFAEIDRRLAVLEHQ